jgi:endonuclease YncB( thermonuclease family)
MIKKIMTIFLLILSLTSLIACNNDDQPKDIVLPNLSGMNRSQVLTALSAFNLQVSFGEIIDNSRPEGLFHSYQTGFQAGMTVEPGTQIIIYFVAHEVLNGERLPDLTGLNQAEIDAILIDLDLNYSFVQFPTKTIEEGEFAGYAGNFQAGMVVDFWSNVVVQIAAPVITNKLLITKYVEGLTNNKAIEIRNFANETIDLSDYRISIYTNGSESISINIPLTGTLEPNELLVIAYDQSEPELREKADIITNDLFFDGNDVVAITFKNGQIVDMIGTIGFNIFYISNETFVRRSHITTASTEYSMLDWDIYAVDNFSMLGTHPVTFPSLQSFTYDPSQTEIPYLTPGGMVLVSYDYANDGDTSTFFSLDPNVADFTGANRIRFVGIDTPEMTPTPEPHALAATLYLRSILENAEVIYLMHDPDSGLTETYGRSLALVWADGLLVNVEMVRMGYSTAKYNDEQQRLVFNGVSLNRIFERAQEEAQKYRRGIWS